MENMIYCKDLTLNDYKILFDKETVFCFDTESSLRYRNLRFKGGKIDTNYKNTAYNVVRKDYKDKLEIRKPMFLKDGSKNPNFDFEVHVYSWAISNTKNDIVVWGKNLTQFLEVVHCIVDSRIEKDVVYNEKELSKIFSLEMWVHNLSWDIEFVKYELLNQGYTYQNSKVKYLKKIPEAIKRGHFNIVENKNLVYSAQITHKQRIPFLTIDKTKHEVVKNYGDIKLNLKDSMKISSDKLEVIGSKLITIDEKYLKKQDYNYEMVRVDGYDLTEKELEYLYCDVYILKEWYKQYYMALNTKRATGSSIAFEKICKEVWGEDFKYTRDYETEFPPLACASAKEVVKKSYQGGWTQANRKFVNEPIACDMFASIDINSSYPSIFCNRPLPYGQPVKSDDFVNNPFAKKNKKKILKEIKDKYENNPDYLVLYDVCFDGFKNKKSDNLIGEFQIGHHNLEDFKKYVPNINSSNEYIHTNMFDGKYIGTNGNSVQYRYSYPMWSFELKNILLNTNLYKGEKTWCNKLKIFKINTMDIYKKGYDIEAVVVFKAKVGFFKEGIEKYAQEKIEYKKTNKVRATAAKNFINQFSGKHGATDKRVERYVDFDEDGLVTNYRTDCQYLDDKKYYKAIISACTAWGRVNLRTMLYKIGYNNVLYFDTDSLYTLKTVKELKKICGDELHPTELGKWDIEKEYDKFKVLGAKKYIMNCKTAESDDELKLVCKCAGLTENMKNQMTFETFYLGREIHGKKQKLSVKGGNLLIDTTFTLNLSVYGLD